MTEREKFEAWALSCALCTYRDAQGAYKYESTRWAYEGWAARHAMEHCND
ncbi:hypothetical protein ACEUCJ_14975 [Aeromonas rivipollensis]|jgi:hypothetical protein